MHKPRGTATVRRRRKTIHDVTKEEWAALTKSAIDVLQCARFTVWIHHLETDQYSADLPVQLDKLAQALTAIGLPHPLTQAEASKTIEDYLRGHVGK